MKKIGIILFLLFIWIGVNAEPKQTQATQQITDTVIAEKANTVKSSGKEESSDFVDKVVEKAINAKLDNLDGGDTPTSFVATVVFLVIVMPVLIVFAAIVLIVYFSAKSRKEQEKIRHDLYLKALESGQPLPEKFFAESVKRSSNLKRGAIWLAVGLAITIGFLISGDADALFLGIIPAFVGAAYLLVYFLEDKKNKTGINE